MYRDTIANTPSRGPQGRDGQAAPVSFLIGSAWPRLYRFGDIFMFTVGAHADPAWAHL